VSRPAYLPPPFTRAYIPLMTTDYAAIVRNFTDEAVANARTTTAVRDGAGNLRSLTDAEAAFAKAINAEWRRRFDRV
jgi:hypothetical protein